VHRSSESFAALAAALAKAQAKLVNPEKSLTATITTGRAGEAARTFRYAPLSSGLEIVRKTLSEYEIAVIQTTAVDQASRMLNLTTLLAHSSGEWIASYWPVCALAEIANPHRMGAALTYARRYALFTLVGIAGEDDLDAPDICMPSPMPAVSRTGSTAGGLPPAPRSQGNGKARGTAKTIAVPAPLPAAESAVLRQKLLDEIAGFASPDSAIAWAREALAAKNTLTPDDAKLVEEGFEQRLEELMQLDSAEGPVIELPTAAPVDGDQWSPTSAKPEHTNAERVDKSLLTVSEPRRYRNKDHLRFITQQPCLLCARKPSDAHHLRFVQPRALGRKASDEFAVPLCRTHHRAVHRSGDERAWWKASGIDPIKVARKLWKDTLTSKPRDPVGAVLHEPRQTLKAQQVDEKAP
jgi:hypothetical protein